MRNDWLIFTLREPQLGLELNPYWISVSQPWIYPHYIGDTPSPHVHHSSCLLIPDLEASSILFREGAFCYPGPLQ
jgi:hypothetical protein